MQVVIQSLYSSLRHPSSNTEKLELQIMSSVCDTGKVCEWKLCVCVCDAGLLAESDL